MLLPSPQAVLSDDGVGVWLGEPDPPKEPITLQASVPPHQLRLGGLHPHTPYHIRVACTSSQGPSPWTHWLPVETPEGGKKELVWGRHHSLPCWTLLTSMPPPAAPVTHSPHVALVLPVHPLTPQHGPLASLPDLFPALLLMGGLHELPTCMPIAPCPRFLGTGEGGRKRWGASFPSSLSSSTPGPP